MKKIHYISLFVLLITFIGCSEDFLERKDLYRQLDENFYSNPEQISQALTAAYTKLTNNAGANNYNLVLSIMSDDRLGGGGINDLVPHDADEFTNSAEDTWNELWGTQYEGIFRTNMIINRFDQAEYDNEQDRNRDLGEAYFLRGYFYYRLAVLFGTVPVITDPSPVNLPRATPEEIFAQIGSDLKMAIELMPNIPWDHPDNNQAERNGHATKWAAEGIMARAFLFYTGFYGQTTMPLVDGGSITSAEVIGWLQDCIQNSGHALLNDPRNLWTYTADLVAPEYSYVADNGLLFAGDGNEEIVFAIKYASYSDWNYPGRTAYSNQAILYQGLRISSPDVMSGCLPFGDGWGFAPVNPYLWDSFEPGDVRQQGSILSLVDGLPEEQSIADAYVLGGEMGDPMYQETGYWSKKGLPTVVLQGLNIRGYYYVLYEGNQSMQHWNMQDDPILRYADVLLMAAELLGPGAGDVHLNAVRSRAGLGNASATLENIKRERRHELCFEGLRYHDLLRWGDADAAFAEASGFTVYTAGVPEDSPYTNHYNPERKFLKIPESQIRLSDGVLVQDPGWQ
jgi:hypothetical protein